MHGSKVSIETTSEEYAFDNIINSLTEHLSELSPDGIDAYLDFVNILHIAD
jgi:NADPH-dependent curcumin reductase CurA